MKQLNTLKIYILVILCYTNEILYLQYCVKIVRYSSHFLSERVATFPDVFWWSFFVTCVSSDQKYTPSNFPGKSPGIIGKLVQMSQLWQQFHLILGSSGWMSCPVSAVLSHISVVRQISFGCNFIPLCNIERNILWTFVQNGQWYNTTFPPAGR